MPKIDLTYGNPEFLFPYWMDQDLPDAVNYYPSKYMGEVQNEDLERVIRIAHKTMGNVLDVDQYEIVVGNGASQLISATVYETFGTLTSAPAPYFQRFPVLAQIGGDFWSERTQKMILTAPNNPTGSFDLYDEHLGKSGIDIVDACYNWPQYCDVRKLDDEILIFSLSKATGHAGTRLGWALFKNKELASQVKRSVEMTTMGVSHMAQDVGRFVLHREVSRFAQGKDNVFSAGRQVLNERWDILNKLNLPFKILNDRGMFAWNEGEIPSHVVGISGDKFGDSIKKFRLNIGCSVSDFKALIEPYIEIKKDD